MTSQTSFQKWLSFSGQHASKII